MCLLLTIVGITSYVIQFIHYILIGCSYCIKLAIKVYYMNNTTMNNTIITITLYYLYDIFRK